MFLHFAPEVDYIHVLYNFNAFEHIKHVYVQIKIYT